MPHTAAQIEADVGVEHIADVLREGLMDTTERAGTTRRSIEEFDAACATCWTVSPSWKPC